MAELSQLRQVVHQYGRRYGTDAGHVAQQLGVAAPGLAAPQIDGAAVSEESRQPPEMGGCP